MGGRAAAGGGHGARSGAVRSGRPVAVAWLVIVPLLGSLVLRPLHAALLAAWTVLLGLGLALAGRGQPVGWVPS